MSVGIDNHYSNNHIMQDLEGNPDFAELSKIQPKRPVNVDV